MLDVWDIKVDVMSRRFLLAVLASLDQDGSLGLYAPCQLILTRFFALGQLPPSPSLVVPAVTILEVLAF